VDVLDREHERGRARAMLEPGADRVVEPLPKSLRVQLGQVGCRRCPEQRRDVRAAVRDLEVIIQGSERVGIGLIAIQAELPAQEIGDRPVRQRRAIRQAPRIEPDRASLGRERTYRLHEARLADARLAHDANYCRLRAPKPLE
jgi:hypothetical protein